MSYRSDQQYRINSKLFITPYYVQCFIRIRTLIKLIIPHVRLFMIISHVKIIAFQRITNHSFWTFYIGGKPVVYIINRKIHGCLEITDLFLVLNMIFSYISCSTIEINLVFLSTHVLFSIETTLFFVFFYFIVHGIVGPLGGQLQSLNPR